jgi:tetratricopeptide (TPR) repeat protein
VTLFSGGRLQEAEVPFHKALEIAPAMGAAHYGLGLVYLMEGKREAALAEIQKEKNPVFRLCGLVLVNHALGRQKESESALAELTSKYAVAAPYQIAQAYAFRGEADRAFEWLDRSISEHDGGISEIRVDPILKPLRADARYKALLARLRLPS